MPYTYYIIKIFYDHLILAYINVSYFSGLVGFINSENISDDRDAASSSTIPVGMTVHARVLNIDKYAPSLLLFSLLPFPQSYFFYFILLYFFYK